MIDMCVKANTEGGESPLNGQATQGKKRRPLDDLSVSVSGDSKKNRPGDSADEMAIPLPPCEAVEAAVCEEAGGDRAQENQQPAAALAATLAAQLPPLPSVNGVVGGVGVVNGVNGVTSMLPPLSSLVGGATLPSLPTLTTVMPTLPTPPAAHQQVAQTLPDDVIIPSPPSRRRSLLMWNPRLRGKDERRKVLKISISKLRLIDDPEVFLRRSVLVNNTLKKLQKEIRDEKTSQRFYDVRNAWRPLAEETCFDGVDPPAKRRKDAEPEDLRQESSDEEIFGVSSDVVRVSVPKQPTNGSSSSSSSSESEDENGESTLATAAVAVCQASECVSQQMAATHSMLCNTTAGSMLNCRDSNCTSRDGTTAMDVLQQQQQQQQQTSSCSSSTLPTLATASSAAASPSAAATAVAATSTGSVTCATQFRRLEDSVSVLDSVVYHSLIASLES